MASSLLSTGFISFLTAAILLLFVAGIVFLVIQGGSGGGRSPNLGFIGSQKTKGMVNY